MFEEFRAQIEWMRKRNPDGIIFVRVTDELANDPNPITFWQYCCDNNIKVEVV